MNSLNPTMKVSDQIKDVIIAHEGSKAQKDIKAAYLGTVLNRWAAGACL